ncbi:peptidoglycan-binding protein [Pseudomonas sp. A-RE-26]|uniref:peptidoglycan-binding protein n=1 Tax=Pseudomonas sp. A-RE-26 TaxID=2832402 RepID=UPI001CC069FD|nr:peptidoglycan-binding protein [Pseudomonas sp. A-RE-26]
MRKSLLVLLLWAPFAMALLPPPGQRLDQPTQQAIQRFLLHNRILDTPQDLDPTQPSYGIFRRGRVYTDPETQELLGLNVDDIGSARFVNAGDLSTLAVQRATREIRPGDRLLHALAPIELAHVQALKPAPFVQGQIIDIPKGVTQIGVLDAITLNKGRRDGLVEGQLLTVIKTGATVRDTLTNAPVTLPDERAGTLLVFRTFEKLSYGLVLSASHPLAVLDRFETVRQSQ